MVTTREAQWRHALFYKSLTQSNHQDFELLDREFPQISNAISFLMQQAEDRDQSALLIDFIKELATYLRGRGLNKDLLLYCQAGLDAASELQTNSGWLYLLIHEGQWALGQWDQSLSAVQTAIETTKDVEPNVHARAVLALGHLQFNRGQYDLALPTLSKAEILLTDVSDYDGVADVKAEFAAYHLNRNEHKKALSLYQEVDQLRRRTNPAGSSNHTLLMLGVSYRRLGAYQKAKEVLIELIQRGESQKDLGAVATGKHHLAWIFFDRRDLKAAEELGIQAKEIYETLNDPRGSSDADEQLGLIRLAKRDFVSSRSYLQRSLIIRQQLGNQQGEASSLRRLAKLHFAQRNCLQGVHCLRQSLFLYHKLKMLTLPRLYRVAVDLLG